MGEYARQYYVDVPQDTPLVRFVLISPALTFPDGTYSYDAASPRYRWAAEAIDGARDAAIPWVVVGMHKPCLSTGEYACDPGPDLLNLLVERRVDLVLMGHEHLYQRTAQLATGPSCPAIEPGMFTATCVADADSTMDKGAGTVFVTVGTGGRQLRELHPTDPEAPYFVANQGSGANGTWGSLEVTATRTGLAARFVRAAGDDFTDTFLISAASPETGLSPPAGERAPRG